MIGIVDFALSKAKTTLALALVIIIAGSYARSSFCLLYTSDAADE